MQRIVVRRNHLWEDALKRFKSGLDFRKYVRVLFVGEPAVDDGGPLREFLHLLMGKLLPITAFFCDKEARISSFLILAMAQAISGQHKGMTIVPKACPIASYKEQVYF